MSDILDEIFNIINENWNDEVEKPEIVKAIDYRSLDLQNKDYVILNQTTTADSFLGIGGREYRCDVAVSVVVKSGRSRERVWEIFEEVRRILRTKSNWSPYVYMLTGRTVDLSDRERKIYTFAFDVIAWKVENI